MVIALLLSVARGLWFKEFHSPARVSSDGRLVSQEFHQEDDSGVVSLVYFAEHDPRLVAIDDLPGLQSWECSQNSLTLVFEEQALPVSEGNILVGNHTGRCQDDSLNHVLKRVKSVRNKDEKTLLIDVENASLEHALKNAKIRFYSDKVLIDDDDSTLVGEEVYKETQEKYLMTFKWNPLDWIASGIANIASGIRFFSGQFLGAVGKMLEEVRIGNVAINFGKTMFKVYPDPLGFNYDKDQNAAKEIIFLHKSNRVACTDCYARVNTVLIFDLDIVNGKLDRFEMIANNSMNANLGFYVNRIQGDWKFRTQPKIVRSKPVTIYVGKVPIQFNLSMSTTLGADGSSDSPDFTAINVGLESVFPSGVRFQSPKQWSIVRDIWTNVKGGFKELDSDVKLNLEVDISPTILVTVSNIGYFSTGVEFEVETHAVNNPSASEGTCKSLAELNYGVMLSSMYEVDATIRGAKVSQSAKNEPTELFRYPIMQGCADSRIESNDGYIKLKPSFSIGRLWSGAIGNGAQTSNCPVIKKGFFSAQFLKLDWRGNLQMLATMNLHYEDGKVCSLQGGFDLQKTSLTPETHKWIPSSKQPFDFTNCQTKLSLNSLTITGTLSEDKKEFDLKALGGCFVMKIRDDYVSSPEEDYQAVLW